MTRPTPRTLLILAVSLVVSSFGGSTHAATNREIQNRLSSDVAGGKPIVIHATVALSEAGERGPEESPWWSGANGIRTLFSPKSGWKILSEGKASQPGPLTRFVAVKVLIRAGRQVQVYLVADGWEERLIQKALINFYAHARGGGKETLTFGDGAQGASLAAGGWAHVAAYLGRNGMEDVEPTDDDTYNVSPEEEWLRRAADRPDAAFDVRPQVDADRPVSAVVLCSDSKAYFFDKLRREGAYPLLLTVGSHRPEARALEAALNALLAAKSGAETRNAGAEAYVNAFGVGKEAAKQKFWSGE